MFLQTTVIGHIGKDAHITDFQGKKVVNFSVAHTESYKNAQGVQVESTQWVECAMWESVAVAPYLKKGTLVQCIGTPKTQAYTDKQGELKASFKLGVISLKLLSAAKKDDAVPEAETPQGQQGEKPVAKPKQTKKQAEPVEEVEPLDDLPF